MPRLDNTFERKLKAAGVHEPLCTILSTDTPERTAALGSGVKSYVNISSLSNTFIGVAQVGNSLYVGDGLNLSNFSSDYVTLEMFNGNGDGITDNTTAINNALAYCSTSGKTLQLMPKKVYNTTGGHVWNYFTHSIYGNGSKIKLTVNNVCLLYIYTPTSDSNSFKNTIKHIELAGTNVRDTATGQIGITFGDGTANTTNYGWGWNYQVYQYMILI